MSEFFGQSMYFGVFLSIAAYHIGLFLRKKLPIAICNPLLIAVAFVMGFIALTGMEYAVYYDSAKYLSYLLTPATVCLAIPLYEQLRLLRENAKAVAVGIISGVIASLAGVFLMALLFGFSHEQYVTLLPKSVTTAIGIGISEELGGIASITVASIIVTGIFGNMAAQTICRIFRIEEPVARGLAIGCSAHVIGTAKAMEMGRAEGAASSLAVVLSGLLTVILASFCANFIL